MPDFGERIHDIAREALAEQERSVTEIRGRGAPLLGGGAVIAGLLAKPIFASGHPTGALEWLAASAGFLGAAALLVSVVILWLPYRLAFSQNANATYQELWRAGVLDQPAIDLVLADAMDDRRGGNEPVVRRLTVLLAVALSSLILETLGLAAAAALAS